MSTLLTDLFYTLREQYINTPPPAMWNNAGPFCMTVKKAYKPIWTGTGIGYVPAKLSMAGNSGADAAFALAYAGSTTGVRFEMPARDHYQFMSISDDVLEFATEAGMADTTTGLASQAADSADAAIRTLSSYLLSDGTGRLAKGDGLFSVAGNVITFKNPKSVTHFAIGDVLVLVDEGAAVPSGGMPAPRAPAVAGIYPQVTAIGSSTAGTITVSANLDVTIPTAANTDYIGKRASYFGRRGIVDGVFRWIPRTLTEANTTLWTVDRSIYPSRLAGARVGLTGGESPYQIVGLIGERLKDNRGSINQDDDYVVLVPSCAIGELMEEIAANSIKTEMITTAASTTTYTMGVSVVRAMIPDVGPMSFMVDHRLTDPTRDESAGAGSTWLALNMNDWFIATTNKGMGWKRYDSMQSSGLMNNPSTPQDFYAQYGLKGNLVCKNTAHQVIASPTALD